MCEIREVALIFKHKLSGGNGMAWSRVRPQLGATQTKLCSHREVCRAAGIHVLHFIKNVFKNAIFVNFNPRKIPNWSFQGNILFNSCYSTKGVSPAKLSCNIMSIVQCVHLYSATPHSKTMFKGTVQRDFRPQDFFILRTSLGHWPMGKIYPNLVKFSLSYSIFSGFITSLSQSPRSMILRWVNLSQGISQIFYTGL